jgi:hypothetical protein
LLVDSNNSLLKLLPRYILKITHVFHSSVKIMIHLLFTNDIALSMFMFSLFFVVVCGHFKWKWICAVFFHGFFISILSLEIQLSKGGCTIFNRFNLAIYVCLSLARKWISKCHRWLGLFAFEMIGGCSLCWYWWNYWQIAV